MSEAKQKQKNSEISKELKELIEGFQNSNYTNQYPLQKLQKLLKESEYKEDSQQLSKILLRIKQKIDIRINEDLTILNSFNASSYYKEEENQRKYYEVFSDCGREIKRDSDNIIIILDILKQLQEKNKEAPKEFKAKKRE